MGILQLQKKPQKTRHHHKTHKTPHHNIKEEYVSKWSA